MEKAINCQKKISDVSRKTTGEPQESNPLAELIQVLPGTAQPALPTNQVKAKLPKLILPKSRGDVTTWTGFWDSYKSAVHDNASLSKIDKFNYLKLLLEGAASRAIQGLTLSSSNFDSAVEILKQRFGRPQQIISAHMDEILKIQPCPSDRPSSLRFLYDKLRRFPQRLRIATNDKHKTKISRNQGLLLFTSSRLISKLIFGNDKLKVEKILLLYRE